MTRLTNKTIRLAALFAITAAISLTARAQTATWSNGAADNDWNNALNWDIGVPAEGTNAVIGAGNTVNYNAPMTATSFAGLNNSGTLNVSAAGFNMDAAGLAAYTGNASSLLRITASGGVLATNSATIALATDSAISVAGGVLIVTNSTGNITFGVNANNNGAGFTNIGGTVVFSQPFQSRGRFTRFAMHGGTLDLLGGGGIFESSNDQERQFLINGGTASLGDFSIARTLNGVSAAGLVVSNGVVNVTSLRVGVANAAAGTTVAGGVLTNTGAFTICDRNNGATTGNRRIHFYIRGGSVYSTDPAGIIVANQSNSGSAAASIIGGNLDINAGLLVAEGITLVKDNTLMNAHATLTLAGTGEIYLGPVGLAGNIGVSGTSYTMTFSGGTLGAKGDFSIIGDGTLSGTFTLKAADLAGNPHNITHNGVWSGSGTLTKTGGGTLTLTGANTYSGNTIVNQGTLALGGSGSIAGSPAVILGSGTTFDASGVSGGFTLAASRTLGGFGVVTGGVATASGAIINPGSNVVTGTLSFSNSVTQTGGTIIHFDLSTNPSGPDNDFIIIAGDLNASGANTMEISGGGGTGSVHPLIRYGGNFNGTVGNFSLSGASGTLSNNASLKTIYLVVATAIRAPTNVVWVGNSLVNDWDTVNRTNWLNAGALDFFVSGDNVLFDGTGAANPNVNVVGNVAPASTRVGAAANYTFSGSGNITGPGGLIKTNTGTLTILTTNAYTGVTTIGGGALEVSSLALGGGNSGIGAASVDPNNLVIDGGTLRYLGGSVTTDRGMTINSGGATIDASINAMTLTEIGVVNGSGILNKAGRGTLVLGVANGYSGGTVINDGQLQVNANTAAGTGGITNNGATLRIQGALTLDNAMNFSGTCALDIGNAGGNTATRGAWSGNGTVNYINVDPNNRTVTIGGAGAGGGHMWDFSGTVDYGTNSGFFRINNDNSTFNFGSSNATFNVGTGTGTLNQRNGGTTTHLGALIGGPNTKLSGRGNTGAAGATTYSIGGNNLSTAFAGAIDNGSGTTAITKVGTGTLILSGNSTYTGTTLVMEGTLQVDGEIPSGIVTVLGGTLAGNGTFGLSVDVEPGGTLSPGDSIGRITMNGLTLQPGSTNFMELNKDAATNDVVASSSSISYGGTLIVTNLAGSLADGDSFRLFDATPGNYFGAFDTIILPTVAAPLVWDTSGLTLDGTIKLLVPLVTRPTISIATIEGTDFVLRGTNNGNGSTYYYVLTSTNVAAPLASWTAIATNQFELDGTFALTNAFNPGTPQRYYLLKTP